MASYCYRCESCGDELELQAAIGTARRMIRCDCGGVKRLRIGVGVNVSAHALETKGGEVRASDAMEARWQRDMPAYKRMRRQGMQPDGIDGAARLEDKVADQIDIELQRPAFDGVSRERYVAAKEEAAELKRVATHGA